MRRRIMTTTASTTSFVPLDAGTGKEISLAMEELWLTGEVLAVGGRLLVRHSFRSNESKPLEVIYAFGLPRDAALRRFRVEGEGFSVASELKPVQEAVQTYEEGIEKGLLSTLAKQYGDGLVNLTLGNLRPNEVVTVLLEVMAGVESRDHGFRFRFPFTLAPCYHARVVAAEVEPGVGEMELPEDEFGDLILPQFAKDAAPLHRIGFDLSVRAPLPIEEIGSSSHSVRVVQEADGRSRVRLAIERDVPNRDLVLDVRTRQPLTGVIGGVTQEGKGHFAVVVPSVKFGNNPQGKRRVVFVLDRSGSMRGIPLEQARKAIEACLGALSNDDLFGLLAFDDKVELFRSGLVQASRDDRSDAREFLRNTDARGGTELAAALLESGRLLSGEGGDVLVMTDGQVYGTEKILQQVRGAGIRIHCLGIGSASQDRFLALLARKTGGVSRFLTARERVDLAAVDLFASIGRPVASGLKAKIEGISARLSPEPSAFVFAGTPLVVFGEADGAGEAQLVLEYSGESNSPQLAIPIHVVKSDTAETIRLLHGARMITDLESELVFGEGRGAGARRRSKRQTGALETFSRTFGLASREMALVAVVKRKGDRAGEIPVTRIVAVGMPEDTAFGSYFDHAALEPSFSISLSSSLRFAASDEPETFAPAPIQKAKWSRSFSENEFGNAQVSSFRQAEGPDDVLLELAGRLEPDGGMPGDDSEERILATIVALLCFLAEGHSSRDGVFRSHVERLVGYLEQVAIPWLQPERRLVAAQIVKLAGTGQSVRGDWLAPSQQLLRGSRIAVAEQWSAIERELGQVY